MTDRENAQSSTETARWPAANGAEIVFLLDAASPLEERILREWIETNRPEGTPLVEGDVVAIESTRRPGRTRNSGGLDPILATREEALLAPLRVLWLCLLYTSPSPRDKRQSRMPSSA